MSMPPAGVPLQMASNREEFRALAPLVVATLNALNTFSDEAFRVHLSVGQQSQSAVFRGLLYGQAPCAWLVAMHRRHQCCILSQHFAHTDMLKLVVPCRSFSRC